MGPLQSLYLLLTVSGSVFFDLSHMCHHSSNKRPVTRLPRAPFTLSPCRTDPSPLLCPALSMWFCSQRLLWRGDERLSQESHGCTQGALAQLAPGWRSVRSSAFLLWLLCLTSSLWNNMHVNGIEYELGLCYGTSSDSSVIRGCAGTSSSVNRKAFLK